MEVIYFASIIILFFWVYKLSERIDALEKFGLKKETFVNKAFDSASEVKVEKVFQTHSQAMPNAKPIVLPTEALEFKKDLEVKNKILTPEEDAERATNWLNRIGVVAVLLGMVFFFKYAIDQGWINPWMRVVMGLLVGGLFIYLGELWKEKYGSRALALVGGGVGLLYFSLYAAYQFYQILVQPLAFAGFVLVAICSIWLAFRHSSLVLGIIGFLGAYGAPILLSSGHDQHFALYVYLGILNIAVLSILFKKFWAELIFLTLVGTIVNLYVWGGGGPYATDLNNYISLFNVIFTSVIYILGSSFLLKYHSGRGLSNLPVNLEKNLSVIQLFSGLFFLFFSYDILSGKLHSLLSPVMLLGGVLVFFSYALTDRLNFRRLNYTMVFVGAGFLVMSAYWQWHGKSLAFTWLVLALLGSTIGTLVKREELRVWAIGILLLSLVKSMFEPYTQGVEHVFLFNAKFALMTCQTLGLLYTAWLYKFVEYSEFEENSQKMLEIGACILLWLSVTFDVNWAYESKALLAQNINAFWWIIFPLAIASFSGIAERGFLLKLGLIMMLLSLFRVIMLPYSLAYSPVFNAKFGLMVLQCLALILIGRFSYSQEKDRQASDWLTTSGIMLFWFSVSWEISQYFRAWDSKNARNLSLSLWWIIYAAMVMGISGLKKSALLRKVAIALFALAIVKVFLYDVSTLDTVYRIISFIVLGVILLSVSFTYQKNKEKIVEFLDGEKK